MVILWHHCKNFPVEPLFLRVKIEYYFYYYHSYHQPCGLGLTHML